MVTVLVTPRIVRLQRELDKSTLHDLRHSAITNWANQLPIIFATSRVDRMYSKLLYYNQLEFEAPVAQLDRVPDFESEMPLPNSPQKMGLRATNQGYVCETKVS